MHEIGVLFVHGIGQQSRGRTLLGVGEPLFDWIRRWVAGSDCVAPLEGPSQGAGAGPDPGLGPGRPAGGIVTLDSVLFEDIHDAAPAHAIIRMEMGAADDRRTSSWLLAEAFWADSFPDPDFPEVVTWTIKIFPWIFASFMSRRLGRPSRGSDGSDVASAGQAVRWALAHWLQILAAGLCIPLIVVFQLLLFLLLLSWLIPIPAVRRYLRRVHEVISGYIGDSYIFTSSSMRRQAVGGSVRRQMAWLEARCEKLVIVAHSQGAAATYLTLGNAPPDRLRVLITFGSGLLKLQQLVSERLSALAGIVSLGAFLATFPLIFVIVEWLGWYPQAQKSWPPLEYATIVLSLGIWGTMVAMAASWDGPADLGDWARELEKRGIVWVDAFTSADPVPNGPVFPPGSADRPVLPRSIEVTNRRSLLTDHTTYAENVLEFVSLLATTIARDAGSSIPLHKLTDVDQAVLAEAPFAQQAEARARSRDYWLLGLSAILLSANLRFVEGLGAWMARACAPVLGWAGMLLSGAARDEVTALERAPAITGLVTVALAWFLAKLALDKLFDSRMEWLLRTFFQRRPWTRSGRTGWVKWRAPDPLPLLPHFVSALALSIAVHSYWPTPLRFFEAYTQRPWPHAALIAQTACLAMGIAFVLNIMDMWGFVGFVRKLRDQGGAEAAPAEHPASHQT